MQDAVVLSGAHPNHRSTTDGFTQLIGDGAFGQLDVVDNIQGGVELLLSRQVHRLNHVVDVDPTRHMVTIAFNALASSSNKPFGNLAIRTVNTTKAQGADSDGLTAQGLDLLLSASEQGVNRMVEIKAHLL